MLHKDWIKVFWHRYKRLDVCIDTHDRFIFKKILIFSAHHAGVGRGRG